MGNHRATTQLTMQGESRGPRAKAPFPPPETPPGAFDAFLAWYRSSSRHRLKTLIPAIASVRKKDLVADVGCYGGLLAPYLKTAGCKAIEGFDIDANSLRHASRVYAKVYRWDADCEPAPVESERYDLVVALEMIEHINRTDQFLAEINRITRRSGSVIISTPNLASLLNRWRLLFGKMPLNAPAASLEAPGPGVDPSHAKIATASEWERAIAAHNFTIIRVYGISNHALLTPLDKLRPSLSGTLLFVLERSDPTPISEHQERAK